MADDNVITVTNQQRVTAAEFTGLTSRCFEYSRVQLVTYMFKTETAAFYRGESGGESVISEPIGESSYWIV